MINMPTNNKDLMATISNNGFDLQHLMAIFGGQVWPQSREKMVAICKDDAKRTGEEFALAMDGANLVLIKVFATGQSDLLWNFGEVPNHAA
jgi:hypothetical protein